MLFRGQPSPSRTKKNGLPNILDTVTASDYTDSQHALIVQETFKNRSNECISVIETSEAMQKTPMDVDEYDFESRQMETQKKSPLQKTKRPEHDNRHRDHLTCNQRTMQANYLSIGPLIVYNTYLANSRGIYGNSQLCRHTLPTGQSTSNVNVEHMFQGLQRIAGSIELARNIFNGCRPSTDTL